MSGADDIVVPAALPVIAAARPRYFLFVNGIRAEARGNVDEWPVLAEDYVEQRTPDKAGRYAYHVGALDRWLWQRKHVRNVCTILTRRRRDDPDTEVVAVGHSNGAAILCAALATDPVLRISELHLVAAAEHADFDRNGLNAAVDRGQVRRVVVYWSPDDEVLGELAAWSRRAFGWLGLGYGSMGATGPDVATMSAAARLATRTVGRPGYGHSDWFDVASGRFGQTMRLVTGGVTDLPEYVLPPVGGG